MDETLSSKVDDAVNYLKAKLPQQIAQPAVGIICGSGLGRLSDVLLTSPLISVPYGEIPHFVISTGIDVLSVFSLRKSKLISYSSRT